MSTSEWFDVAVVGGGPAGALAASAAVRAGARTVLLERSDLPRTKVCGEYLCPGAAALLRDAGFAAVLAAARTGPLLGMRLFDPGGREIATLFPEGRPGLSVRRSELDWLLSDASGAEVRRGAGVTDMLERDDHVELVLGTTRVRARAVVGADGRNSVIARRAGLRLPARGSRAAVHAYYRGVAGTGPHGEMHLPGDGTYFGLNPGPDGRVNVTFVTDLDRLGVKPGRGAATLLDDALRACRSLARRFANAHADGAPRVLSPLEVRARDVAAGRIFLAGDAAGFLDPLTGEGLFGAVTTGRLAGAWAARAADPAGAAAGYRRAYRRALRAKTPLNKGFQWMLSRPRVLRFLGRRFARSPALADALIGTIGNVTKPTALLQPRYLLALAGFAR